MKRRSVVIFLCCLALIPSAVHAQEASQFARQAMYHRYLEFASYVKGGSIEPHWMADGSSFWYAEGGPDNTVIWRVDPSANTKTPLFNTARLRQALTAVLGHEPPYQGLPFAEFTFVDGEKAVKFTVEDKEYVLRLDSYTIRLAPALSEQEKERLGRQAGETSSPDGRWLARIKDHNIWLRSSHDNLTVPLTTDGIKDYGWSVASWGDQGWWSPDARKLAVKKVDSRKVDQMPFVHWLKPAEEVTWAYYPIAGGSVAQIELFIVDVLSKQRVRVGAGPWSNEDIYMLGWRPDSSELLFVRSDREYKKFELVAADPATGATRVVLSETRDTFVNGWDFSRTSLLTFLQDGKRFIWMSERDGWNHLYLFDINGTLVRQLTVGNFPVVEVIGVDEKIGWVYFTAHDDRSRPYDTHLYRVSLEGKGFARLTAAPGQHVIQFTPSKEFFLDTHSSPGRPPVVELRAADGELLQKLSQANIDALKDLKWRPPEEFVVKAANGTTDLYGVLYKPYDFDPNKKYPVIEFLYAGPGLTLVPRTFTDWKGISPQAWSQLGFIVFIVDGRGTPDRGKAFEDVVYGNFGRHEIPDHLATLKQLAEKRPYMDLRRVGIYGHSWGGYFAIRAMLLAPDVYHVGIASAPAVATADFSVAIEPYMGLPKNNEEAYEYGSNLRLAGNLKGKLLLIHGTSDDDVLFSATMKMVDALTRSGKPYDLLVLPEQDHGIGSGIASGNPRSYLREAIRRYFQEHLKP